MQTFFTIMHSTTARVVRVLVGLWLVIYGADLSAGYAFMLAILGNGNRGHGHRRHLSDGARGEREIIGSAPSRCLRVHGGRYRPRRRGSRCRPPRRLNRPFATGA